MSKEELVHVCSPGTQNQQNVCVCALGKPDEVTSAGSEAGVSNLSEAAELTTYAFATIPYCLPIRRPPNASSGAHPSQCATAPHKSRPAEAACRRRGSPALSCSVFSSRLCSFYQSCPRITQKAWNIEFRQNGGKFVLVKSLSLKRSISWWGR